MSNSNNAYFPFGPAPGNPYQAFLPYDLQISEVDPGIILAPTEPNGVYFVMREVNGCVWQVLNADYVVADAQWEQAVDPNSLINAALPAYALEFCASGTVNRYTAAATIVPGVAVNWVLVWSLDASGNMTTSPLVGTGAGQIANDVILTWNAGSPTVMSAREINLTDTSSNASSWLDNLIVNGTPKWQIRKDGTLVTGIVPYANISGAPAIPSFNNPTFTGTATFTGPVVMEDGLSVTGGETVDTLDVTGNEAVGGNLNVSGTTTTDNLVVTGTATFPTGDIVSSVTGTNGIAVTNTGNVYNASGAALVETITNTDGSLAVTRSGQTVNVNSGSVAPVVPGSWFIQTEYVPATGTPQSGTVSLGPLPGTTANTFRIVYWGVTGFKDGNSNMVFTGTPATNVTWDQATVTVFNGQGNATPFMYFGTAKGGTTPTVSWTTTDYVFATPFMATIAAGIQL